MESKIKYSTNAEYRQAIRKFCDMSCNDTSVIYEDIDDESKDELLYDADSMENKMDEIYEKTRYDPLWINLYEKAAAKFFSTENEIGLVVLFSYDYFSAFYGCLHTQEPWSETNESYIFLLSLL
jgi:hypothetical protein